MRPRTGVALTFLRRNASTGVKEPLTIQDQRDTHCTGFLSFTNTISVFKKAFKIHILGAPHTQ